MENNSQKYNIKNVGRIILPNAKETIGSLVASEKAYIDFNEDEKKKKIFCK